MLLVKHWGCLYSKIKDAPPLPHLSLSKLGFLFHSCKQNNINIGFLFHYKTPLWALCFIVIHQKESRTEKHRPANLLTAFCYFPFVSLKKSLCLHFCKVNSSIAHYYAKPGFFIPVLPFRRYKDFPPKGFNELSTLALSNFDISSWLLFFLLSR